MKAMISLTIHYLRNNLLWRAKANCLKNKIKLRKEEKI